MSLSDDLFEASKRVSPGGVHSPVRSFRGVGGVPRFIARAEGAELFDVDGRSYVDFCLSWGPLPFGHRDPEVEAAVTEALSRGWTFGAAEPYSLELAEIVTTKLPWVQKLRFVSSGTEAVMSALRVARAATGRAKVLKFDGCYHGHVDSMLVRAGSGLADMPEPDSAGIAPHVAADTLVAPLDDDDALDRIFENQGKLLAAVIVEPLPANNGLLPPRPEWLAKVCERARAAGALVIFDEVISGFRVAFGGVAETSGLRPDLVTFGKVMGGGFPAAAYGGRADLMELVAPAGPVYQAGTLSANPVAMVAGITTLRRLLRQAPYRWFAEKTAAFGRALEDKAKHRGIPFRVQSVGSISWGVFGAVASADGVVRSLAQVPATHKATYARVFHGMLERGVYLAPSGFEVSFLSTAHTDALLSRAVDAFDAALVS